MLAAAASLAAQTGENVLLVVNRQRRRLARDRRVLPRRDARFPLKNVCTLATTSDEEIDWTAYEQQIERPIGECLKKNGLQEKVLYIVTTLGVPLKVRGAGSGMTAENGSVDSELTLLYCKAEGREVSARRHGVRIRCS